MRRALLAAAAVLMATGLVWAAGRPGILRTKDGGVYDGTVDEKEEVVAVTVRGITTNIPRENVQSITYGEFEQRWNDSYGKLEKEDVKGRLEAGRRAFDERRYDLAEKAFRDAQAIDANNTEVADMLKLTINQRKLEKSQGSSGDGQPGSVPGAPGAAGGVKPAGGWVRLDKEQVNRIKQLELQTNDAKARFSFKANVAKKYFDSDPAIGMTYPEFLKLNQTERALMIIKNGGDLAKDVEVTSDPEIMLNFRKDVMPLVLQGCATSACHGGNNESSKKFALITPAPDVLDVYTNFYVLQTTRKNVSEGVVDGMFNPAFAMMINRNQPEQSLLLQYGLPEQNADFKHPKVRGFNGIFRNKDDAKYNTIRNFIANLNRLEPEYGFTFTLQRRDAAPEPAAPPASQPTTPTTPGAAVQGAIDGVKNLVK